MKITYYASNTSMGDTPDDDCNKYRAWAAEQLQAEFPDAEIEVLDKDSLYTFVSIDGDDPDGAIYNQVMDIVPYLWDKCPWDFM